MKNQMKKGSLVAVAMGVFVAFAFGGLYASNMGFKLLRVLEEQDRVLIDGEWVPNFAPPLGVVPDGKCPNNDAAICFSNSGQTELALPYNPKPGLNTVSDLWRDINDTVGAPPNCSGPGCPLTSISRFLIGGDSRQNYSGTGNQGNYDIDGVEAARIQVNTFNPGITENKVDYIIVGSHDPGRVVFLKKQHLVPDGFACTGQSDCRGGNCVDNVCTSPTGIVPSPTCPNNDPTVCFSNSGQTELSFPYHGTATNAAELWDEINLQSASGDALISISRFLRGGDSRENYSGSGNQGNFATAPGDAYRIQVTEDIAYIPSHY